MLFCVCIYLILNDYTSRAEYQVYFFLPSLNTSASIGTCISFWTVLELKATQRHRWPLGSKWFCTVLFFSQEISYRIQHFNIWRNIWATEKSTVQTVKWCCPFQNRNFWRYIQNKRPLHIYGLLMSFKFELSPNELVLWTCPFLCTETLTTLLKPQNDTQMIALLLFMQFKLNIFKA